MEIPMAVLMSMPKNIRMGMSIIPPPIPKNPESVPTSIPTKTNMISIVYKTPRIKEGL